MTPRSSRASISAAGRFPGWSTWTATAISTWSSATRRAGCATSRISARAPWPGRRWPATSAPSTSDRTAPRPSGDYDHDGDVDLLTGDISHELQFFRHAGTSWQEDPTVVAGLVVGQNAAPAFGDLDGDGDLDLTVGNYSGTFNYFVNTTPTAAIPEAGSDPSALRLQASPNPFRERVVFRVELAEPGPVDLSVFDASGRRIARLLEGPQNAGGRVMTWDRREAAWPELSSGVYYVRLQNGRGARTVVLTHIR